MGAAGPRPVAAGLDDPAPPEPVAVASFGDLSDDGAADEHRDAQVAGFDDLAGPGATSDGPGLRGLGDEVGAPAGPPLTEREPEFPAPADLDDLAPAATSPVARPLDELEAPADQAPVLAVEDLRRGARRSRSMGRGDRRPWTGEPGDDRDGPGDQGGRRGRDGTGPARRGARRGTRGGKGATGRGGGEGATGEGDEAPDSRTPEEQEAEAKEICLRLLTDRARTKHELGARLRQKGVAAEIAEKVLDRFDEVGLIDDEAFAGAWVRSRHRHRGLGRRAIAQELRRKGVAPEIAETALTEVDDAAEAQRARELVDRKLRTLTATSPEDRQKAARRLLGMLARKGYPPGIAYGVVRTALAEHGADEDELGPADLD